MAAVLMVMLPDRGQGARLGIVIGGDGFVSKEEFNADVGLVKKIPGAAFRKQDKAWGLPLVMDSCYQARELFGTRLRVHPTVSAWARTQLSTVDRLKELASASDTTLPPLIAAHAPRIAEHARPYQRVGMVWLREARGGLLAFVPRLGKTMTVLGALTDDKHWPDGHRRYIVLAGKRAIDKVWAKEIAKWLGDESVEVYVATGSKEQKQQTINLFMQDGAPRPAFLVTNYETIRVRAQIGEYAKVESWEADYPELFEQSWDAIIVDETHKFMRNLTRTKGSMAARGLLFLKEQAGCMKVGLSGTPFPNRPQGLFGVLHWLAPKVFTSFWTWANRYFDVSEAKFGWKVGHLLPEAEDRFYAQNDRYILRRTREEDIPNDQKTVYIDVWCTPEGEQLRQYEAMHRDAEAKVSGGTVSATIVLTEILRLKQLAYSAWHLPDQYKPVPDSRHESAKYDELRTILTEELDIQEGIEKTLVFTQFAEVAEDVAARLHQDKINAYLLTGRTGQRQASQILDDWQNNPGSPYKVLVMTTQTGGTALDLYAADSVHLPDQLWNPDENLQAEERAYIPGKGRPVRVYRYYTEGTVDQYIKRYVDAKDDVQRMILDGRRGVDLARTIITRGKQEG